MAQDITLLGASYSAVPAVVLPKTGGGSATFTDVSDTTSEAEDVKAGTYFYTAAGVKTEGTASSGAAMESGSFIATQSRNITLSVTKLYSHVYIWAADIKGDDNISGNPYGNKKVFSFAADNNTGFYFMGGTYNGTSFAGYFGGIGRWGGNTSWSNLVQFTGTTITIQSMTMGGGNGETIAGKTYNWIAW